MRHPLRDVLVALAPLAAAVALAAAATAAEPVEVRLIDDGAGSGYVYSPTRVTATPGAAIVLRAVGLEPHTVTHADANASKRLFDVVVDAEGTGNLTAPATPGEYPFYCKYHATPETQPGLGMAGVLLVEAAPATPTPDPTPDRTPTDEEGGADTPGPGASVALAALGAAALAALAARRRA